MFEQNLKIESNLNLNESVNKMTLSGHGLKMKSGQFVEVKLDGFFLRRPFSVADSSENSLTLLYKVVGQGTKAITELKCGQALSCLCGLGNGFDYKSAKNPLLIGGGIGAAPLVSLARDFNALGIKSKIVLGFRNKDEIFYIDEFKKLGDVTVATDDGSFGEKGNAVSVIKNLKPDFDRYFACGPMVMLKYLTQYCANGEVSLEARMGCGFGACMGCSVMTKKGAKRVCKEGPVFDAADLLFGED